MTNTELEKNMLINLRETLKDLSSKSEQKQYKKNVPFVHIPIELIEQWADHARMLSDIDWYKEMFDQIEQDAMYRFDGIVDTFCEKYQTDIPDVEAIFENQDWKYIMSEASKLYSLLGNRFDTL